MVVKGKLRYFSRKIWKFTMQKTSISDSSDADVSFMWHRTTHAQTKFFWIRQVLTANANEMYTNSLFKVHKHFIHYTQTFHLKQHTSVHICLYGIKKHCSQGKRATQWISPKLPLFSHVTSRLNATKNNQRDVIVPLNPADVTSSLPWHQCLLSVE